MVAVDSSTVKALEAATSFRKELACSPWFGGLRNRADVIGLCLYGGRDLPSKMSAAIYWPRPFGASQDQVFLMELHLYACLDYSGQASYHKVASAASFAGVVIIVMPSSDSGIAIEASDCRIALKALVAFGT